MSEKKFSFEKVLEESNAQEVKKAAADLYQIYKSLLDAGFNKAEAMMLMATVMRNVKQND